MTCPRASCRLPDLRTPGLLQFFGGILVCFRAEAGEQAYSPSYSNIHLERCRIQPDLRASKAESPKLSFFGLGGSARVMERSFGKFPGLSFLLLYLYRHCHGVER